MTNEDAIKILEINSICSPKAIEFKKAVEIAKNAIEKQIPKKPIEKNPICYNKSIKGEEFYYYDYHCPQCNTMINNESHHCPCGQTLDWSEE